MDDCRFFTNLLRSFQSNVVLCIANWLELINQLEAQGLKIAPKLVVGDGRPGILESHCKELAEYCNTTLLRHMTTNALNKAPEAVQPKVEEDPYDILAESTRGCLQGPFTLHWTAHSAVGVL